MALRYKPAALSVYGRHLKYLPVTALKEAGIHIGVVSAFPSGLAMWMSRKELIDLEEAAKFGADEVDVVMDFEAVKANESSKAEESLAQFALGVEEIKNKYHVRLKIKNYSGSECLG